MFRKRLCLAVSLCLFWVMHTSAALLYVNLNSTNPVAPFSSWATAATNIQDAVDAASSNDEVLVTNGVYQYGGRPVPGYSLTNRLVITNSITVQSVNGPLVTAIAGHQVPGLITGPDTVRCVYLLGGAVLSGFTITNGSTFPGGNDVTAGGDTSGAGLLCPLNATATVSNCVLIGNFAGDFGGGIYGGTLYNCLVVSNTATAGAGSYGGGTFGGTVYNCTLTANSADNGGGDAFGNLVNCIDYGNFPDEFNNYSYSTLNYCCTYPDPGGTGNILSYPFFLNPTTGDYRLNFHSPCINAGDNDYVSSATDLAGNPRIADGTVDMGAYELPYHFVSQNSTNPVAPFSTWATAATNIQDAVDAAANDEIVLVTNGVYRAGQRTDSEVTFTATNRLIVAPNLTVESVNGPAFTSIDGGGVMRCVRLVNGDILSGFTLTNGAASPGTYGGGVYCFGPNPIVSNCVVVENTAAWGGGAFGGVVMNSMLKGNSGGQGGGAASSFLINCLITGNAATDSRSYDGGGGAAGCMLNNCTIVSNQAVHSGGGVAWLDESSSGSLFVPSSLASCICCSNSASTNSNFAPGGGSSANFCCLIPLAAGIKNFTNDPLFVNPAAGDFHLQSNSPCINAGNNIYFAGNNDLDGNPRAVGGTVDIGAYEFQNPASVISYAWLQQYGFATDGSADFLDTDNDGMNNWQEWIDGTDPTNPSSVLQLLNPVPSGTNLVLTWQSVTNQSYYLLRTGTLQPPYYYVVAGGIPGQSGNTSYTDTNAPMAGPYYYRVAVVPPQYGGASPLLWPPILFLQPPPPPGH